MYLPTKVISLRLRATIPSRKSVANTMQMKGRMTGRIEKTEAFTMR